MIRQWVVVAALLAGSAAQAGIYKCVVDGKTTFSQHPCGEAAEVVDVKDSAPVAAGANALATQPSSIQAQHLDAGVNKYVDQRKARRHLDEKIKNLAALKAERDYKVRYYKTASNTSEYASQAAFFQAKANEARLEYDKPIERAEDAVEEARRRLDEINQMENY